MELKEPAVLSSTMNNSSLGCNTSHNDHEPLNCTQYSVLESQLLTEYNPPSLVNHDETGDNQTAGGGDYETDGIVVTSDQCVGGQQSSERQLPRTTQSANTCCSSMLQCEWIGCSSCFNSVEVLIYHLRDVHLFASQHCEQPLHCFWQNCDNFDAIHHKHLTVHVLFHAYHTELKLRGKKILMKEGSEMAKCQLITYLSSIPVDLPPDGFVCHFNHGDCLQNFDSFHSFLVHVRSHIYCNDTKQAAFCHWAGCERETAFRNKYFFGTHTVVHTGAKQFACPQCGAMFANEWKLKGHCSRQIMDESAKCYKCSLCNVNFASQPLLREHIRTHVKLYQCPKCSAPFATKAALRNHWKFKHNNLRFFLCPMTPCNYAAKTQNDLLKHLKNHDGQKYIERCNLCDSVFRTYYGLQTHMECEHNIKMRSEYVCHLCEHLRVFNRGPYLSKHLVSVHKLKRSSGQKFTYMRASNGKFYLAKEEVHQIISPQCDSEGSNSTPSCESTNCSSENMITAVPCGTSTPLHHPATPYITSFTSSSEYQSTQSDSNQTTSFLDI